MTLDLEALIQGYLDGTLTDDEARELHARLKADPSRLDDFILAIDLHASLAGLANEKAFPTPQRQPTATRRASRRLRSRPSGGSWVPYIAAAAVLLFALLMYASRSGSPTSTPALSRREALERERLASIAESQQAEQRLLEIERKKQALATTDDPRKPDPARDELRIEKDRVERELRAAVEKGRLAQEELAAGPEPVPPPPPAAPRPSTQAGIAALDRIEGDVFLTGSAGRLRAAGGETIEPGGVVETIGDKSFAAIVYPDATRVELGANTIIRELKTDAGKRIRLDRGDLRAMVAKQPKDAPMIVASPHGEAKVVGTTLRIRVEQAMRLEVEEGKVELKNLAGKTVSVDSGHYAVAADGVELVAKRLPIGEILLLPDDKRMKRFGGDWQLVKDPAALTGSALEAAGPGKAGIVAVEQIPSYVYFAFVADADKDYFLWVRGATLAAAERTRHDAVVVQIPGGRLTKPAYANIELGRGTDRVDINGYGHAPGYWWIGGDADYFDAQGKSMSSTAVVKEKHGDETPTVVRFARAGPQVLRLYAYETPIRIDAIWLSETQKTRPDPAQAGPSKGPK